jgi:acyl-CoA dehydrogenase
MNCLAAGRSISLPANGVGMSKLCALTTGAYGHVRTQFKMPVGRFEGVEEAIARIGGNTYILDAARVMTAGAIDLGEKPSVVSAIVKYHLTERARGVINDAMDVHGGKGICMGPSNYLARAYQQMPIGITVEGANILTRTMIIFGQGVIRGHPYVLREINATREPDAAKALRDFDVAFCGHVAFVIGNFVRAIFLGFTRGIFVPAPGDTHTRRYYQKLTRFASGFALLADAAMFVLGGSLKRRERLSARLGDILSQLYLASAALKRYEDGGRPAGDLPLLHWSMQDALVRMQEAFYGLFDNLPNRFVALLMRHVIFTYGAEFKLPRDSLGQQVVNVLMAPGPARDRLTAGVFVPKNEEEAVGALEAALHAVIAAEAVEAKMRTAVKAGTLAGAADVLAAKALAAGIITADDAKVLERAQLLRRRVIMVDDFPLDLGKSELFQTTQAVTFEALHRA